MRRHKLKKAAAVLRERGYFFFVRHSWYFVRDTFRHAWVLIVSKVLYLYSKILWGESLAEANEMIFVNPCSIKWRVFPPFEAVWLAGGDWDLPAGGKGRKNSKRGLYALSDMVVNKAIFQHYLEGIDWENTILFQRFAERGGRSSTDYPDERYESSELLEIRCGELDRLFERIKREGYLSQKDLGGDISHEITVNIGRGGELIWNGTGQHRLAMAQVLQLERIPVRVLVRHKTWQRIRREIRFGTCGKDEHNCSSHPDVRSMIEK